MENKIIDIKNLDFSYKDNHVLKNCSFDVTRNSIMVLLGANGAGKSTLFSCIMKQLKIGKQMIKIDSVSLEDISLKNLSFKISYVPQINTIKDLDCIVRDYLVEGRTPYLNMFSIPGKKEYLLVEKYASMVGISHLLNKNIQCLSGGELQLVLITRAVVQETPIILMDEPMSALDLKNQTKVLRLVKNLKNQGKTIILSSHNPNHALILNEDVCMLYDGNVINYGKAKECISQSNLNILYGESILLKCVDGDYICIQSLID